MYIKGFLPFLLIAHLAKAQTTNCTHVLPTDCRENIIRKAAQGAPSVRQFRWQQLELTAFFHFSINTFTNNECGNGKEDISQYNPTKLDAGQRVKTMKDAGFKQVIIIANIIMANSHKMNCLC